MGKPRVFGQKFASNSLATQAVGLRARRRYDRGVAAFVEWVVCRSGAFDLKFRELVLKIEAGGYLTTAEIELLDFLLTFYFELAHMSDPLDGSSSEIAVFSRWESSELLCGLGDRCAEVKRRLPRANRCLLSWGRQLHVDRAPPLHVDLVIALLGYVRKYNLIGIGVGLICMFFGLLRPGEFFLLRRKDVSLAFPTILALLEPTKTSRGKNAYEFASIRDAGACTLLDEFLRVGNFGADDLLWPSGPQEFRRQVDTLFDVFGVGTFGYRLYSLRRGGASRLIDLIPMETLLVRGRWASVKSARTYLESARAELLKLGWSRSTDRKIAIYKRLLCSLALPA